MIACVSRDERPRLRRGLGKWWRGRKAAVNLIGIRSRKACGQTNRAGLATIHHAGARTPPPETHGGLPGRRNELMGPHRFGFFEPTRQAGQACRPQGIDAHARVEGGMRLLDKSALTQRPQMAAHRRRGQPQIPGQLARLPWPLAQQLDASSPMRIGQRRKGAVEGTAAGQSRSPRAPSTPRLRGRSPSPAARVKSLLHSCPAKRGRWRGACRAVTEGAQGSRDPTYNRSRTATPPAFAISSLVIVLTVWPKLQTWPSGSATM